MTETAYKPELRGWIDVTEIDPRRFIQIAYSGSAPQGLGFLHHEPGGLDEETLDKILNSSRRGRIDIDYLNGRSMKFNLIEYEGRRYFDPDWYDHGRESTKHLVREAGLPDVEARIQKAEAEKEELKREWEQAEKSASDAAVKIVQNGQTCQPKNLFDLEFEDPIYRAWTTGVRRAVKDNRLKATDGQHYELVKKETRP